MKILQLYKDSGHKSLIAIFLVLTAIYTWMTLVNPPKAVILGEITAVRAFTLVPFVTIWFIALFGYIKFANYARKIRSSDDGKALSGISRGLLMLALILPLNTIISNLASYIYQQNPDIKPALIIISNYITLLLMLSAFMIIRRGATMLDAKLVRSQYSNVERSIAVLLLLLSGLLIYATFSNPERRDAGSSATFNGYYLPDFLLATTFIMPYMYLWYLGAVSAIRISIYGRKVRGTIYKLALKYLAYGLTVVIIGQMSIRYLYALGSQLDRLELEFLLAAAYLVLLIIGVGFGLIAYGAHKLQKIEDA